MNLNLIIYNATEKNVNKLVVNLLLRSFSLLSKVFRKLNSNLLDVKEAHMGRKKLDNDFGITLDPFCREELCLAFTSVMLSL